MRQFLWYVFQISIFFGFYLWWHLTQPPWGTPNAVLFVGMLFSMLATGIVVRTADWLRAHWRYWRGETDYLPSRPPNWREAARILQHRIAGSVEFRRAVEGRERDIEP